MARSMWTGSIGFGMVNIPVSLQTATSSKSVAFNQIHKECKSRIKELRFCPVCDREVPWDEVEKGYEYTKGDFIAFSDADFEKLPVPSKNLIDIIQFAKLEEVDPIFFEKSYLMEPNKAAKHAYGLLLHVLTEKKLIALGKLTLRTKERLCAMRPAGGGLLLSTLYFPDEINIDLDASSPEQKMSAAEEKMASTLVDMLTAPFDPEQFQDTYRVELMKLIESKVEGVPAQQSLKRNTGANVLDLMESLQASLDSLQKEKSSSKKTSASSPGTAEQKSEKPKKKKSDKGVA